MIHKLPAGHTLTVSVSDGSAHVRQIEDPTIGAVVTSSRSFGPYLVDREFVISDRATVAVAAVALESPALFSWGAGAPEDAAQASLAVNPAGDDNGLAFAARVYGAEGNEISIEYVDPGAAEAALAVSVFNRAITVSLATDGDSLITSTAADVLAAIEASVEASRLVTVEIYAADSGAGDDGSGVVTAMALDFLTGGQGTGIDRALPGALYSDTTNGFVYRNSGTQAEPLWTKLGDAAP